MESLGPQRYLAQLVSSPHRLVGRIFLWIIEATDRGAQGRADLVPQKTFLEALRVLFRPPLHLGMDGGLQRARV